jgi:hypothetical protein
MESERQQCVWRRTMARNHPPTRRPRSNRQPRRSDGRGQVFGLTSTSVNADAYWPLLPSPQRTSALKRRSFSITAAGQSQIHTGFPIKSGKRPDANALATMASAHRVVNCSRG